jgi:hypothetical protein
MSYSKTLVMMLLAAGLSVAAFSAQEPADGCIVLDLVDSVNLENSYFNKCGFDVDFDLSYSCNGHAVMTSARRAGAKRTVKATGTLTSCSPLGGNTLVIDIANPRRAR